jgi:hypothetical protein
MSNTAFKPDEPLEVRRRDEPYELGGLRFIVSSNDYGANLAVFGDLGKGWVELIRFQDYVDDPHYHAPVGGWNAFDRNTNGEPLAWWLDQLRDDLAGWLVESGFADRLADIDVDEVRRNLARVEQAMIDCLPASYARIPGHGVKRIDWSTDESAFQKRNEQHIDVGGVRFDVFFDRDLGATMEVSALTDAKPIPMIRLDDYDEIPHYHAPVGVWFNFDRATLGEPLRWFVDQIRLHLPALLEQSRAAQLIPTLDFDEITRNADVLYDAMAARVPRDCERIPGVGLRRLPADAGDTDA